MGIVEILYKNSVTQSDTVNESIHYYTFKIVLPWFDLYWCVPMLITVNNISKTTTFRKVCFAGNLHYFK